MATCPSCGADLPDGAKANIFGTRRIRCAKCSTMLVLPMKRGVRIGYCVIVAWMGTGLAWRLLAGGNLWVPAVLFGIASVGLWQDRIARRNLQTV